MSGQTFTMRMRARQASDRLKLAQRRMEYALLVKNQKTINSEIERLTYKRDQRVKAGLFS